jgi:hypothetical protein
MANAAPPPANVVAEVPANYTKLLFLDNDLTHHFHFRGMFGGALPNVNLIKVPSKVANESLVLTHPDFFHLSSQLSPSALDIFLLNSMLYGVANGDNYDRSSGINADIVAQVEAWIAANPGDVKAVGIDFDRTITQFEGLNTPAGHGAASFQEGYINYLLTAAPTQAYLNTIPEERRTVGHLLEGNVEYFLGGAARLALIRTMFDTLYAAGIDVYIITNNAMCYSQPTFVNEFLNQLINPAGQGRPFYLVCSRNHPHSGNKRSAWRGATPRVHTLLGGGRRRATRRAGRKSNRRYRASK